MRKTITATELGNSAGELATAVRLRSDRYIVTQRGKPAAALVPIAVLEKYEQNLRALAEVMERTARTNRDADAAELDRLIGEAIAEVRGERRTLARHVQTPSPSAQAEPTEGSSNGDGE